MLIQLANRAKLEKLVIFCDPMVDFHRPGHILLICYPIGYCESTTTLLNPCVK